MNALSQSSFEPPVTSWTLTGSASLSTYSAYDGQTSLSLFAARLSLGPVTASSQAAQTISVEPGEDYRVTVPCNADLGADGITLRLKITDGAAITTHDLTAPLGSGWQVWSLGTYTPSNPSITFELSTPLPALGRSGTWLVDLPGFEEVTRRREIRDAIVSRIGSVAGVGECTSGVASLATMTAFPFVSVQHGEEFKEIRTLTRKTCTLTFSIGVFAKDSDTTGDRADTLDDICGAIETSIEKNDDGAGGNSPYLDLGYVSDVMVESIDPFETEEAIERGVSLWVMTVKVTYIHDRRVP